MNDKDITINLTIPKNITFASFIIKRSLIRHIRIFDQVYQNTGILPLIKLKAKTSRGKHNENGYIVLNEPVKEFKSESNVINDDEYMATMERRINLIENLKEEKNKLQKEVDDLIRASIDLKKSVQEDLNKTRIECDRERLIIESKFKSEVLAKMENERKRLDELKNDILTQRKILEDNRAQFKEEKKTHKAELDAIKAEKHEILQNEQSIIAMKAELERERNKFIEIKSKNDKKIKKFYKSMQSIKKEQNQIRNEFIRMNKSSKEVMLAGFLALSHELIARNNTQHIKNSSQNMVFSIGDQESELVNIIEKLKKENNEITKHNQVLINNAKEDLIKINEIQKEFSIISITQHIEVEEAKKKGYNQAIEESKLRYEELLKNMKLEFETKLRGVAEHYENKIKKIKKTYETQISSMTTTVDDLKEIKLKMSKEYLTATNNLLNEIQRGTLENIENIDVLKTKLVKYRKLAIETDKIIQQEQQGTMADLFRKGKKEFLELIDKYDEQNAIKLINKLPNLYRLCINVNG